MQILRRCTARNGGSRGAVLLLLAASIPLLIAVAAIVVDLGFLHVKRAQVQNAADSAVLAGSMELPGDRTAAVDAAGEYALLSLGEKPVSGAACGDERVCFHGGSTDVRITAPYDASSSEFMPEETIHAEVCSQRRSFFGGFFGIRRLRTCASATAAGWGTSTAGNCGLCLLDPTGTTLSQTGNGTVRVLGGGIAVNSSDSRAVRLTGSSSIMTDGTFGIVGGYSAPGGSLSPVPVPITPIADPFAGLPVPSVPGAPAPGVKISGSTSTILMPGVYSEIRSSSSGQLTLEPGVYVITDGIRLTGSPKPGNHSLFGDGVTIYFACEDYPAPCAPNEAGATFTQTGGTSVHLTPSAAGPWAGVTIFGDRNNTSGLTLTGNSDSVLHGSLYFKSGELSLTGTSGVDMSFDAVVAVGAMRKTGTSDVVIDTTAGGGEPEPGHGGSRLIG